MKITCVAAIVGIATLGLSTHAQVLVVPNVLKTNDPVYGSGTLFQTIRNQQVYHSSEFPAQPIRIKELYFRPDYALGGPFSTVISNFQVNLSTTTKAPHALSSTYAANVGTNDVVVFSGPLAISSLFLGPAEGPKAFDILIPLQTPFVYDPAQGNLLVDIRNSSGSGACRVSGGGVATGSRAFGYDMDSPTAAYVADGVDVLEIIYEPAPTPPLGPPAVLAFAPQSGTSGSVVTLTGTNFSPVAASNIVYFGAVRATVNLASPTSLTVVLPSGATYAPPSVTVAGLTGQANSSFLPTFDGGGAGLDASSFAAKFDLSASSDQIAVSIGDMDGDGRPDVVVANAHANTVGVYRNIGTDGSLTGSTFAPRVDFPGGNPVYGSTIADLDGDGRLDIIMANNGNESGTTISVLRNTGAPGDINSNSFGAKVNFSVGRGPIRLSAGDLDGDGRLDVVVGTASGLSVLRNTSVLGAVSFAPYFQLATGANTWDAETADLDGDGRRDLVAVNYDSGTVSLLRNTGTPGSLSAGSFATKVDIASGTSHDVAIGDLDGDGRVDLVVPRFHNGNVAVYRNVGAPGSITSNSFAAGVFFAPGSGPSGVTIGDVDGDGKPDLAVTDFNVAQISVLRNSGVGVGITSASFAAKVDFASSANPHQVALGDLNGDGRPDAVVTSWGSSSIAVLRNDSLPTPPAITQHPTDRTVIAGSPAAFVSAATGSSPLVYQWRWNGTNISGATNATYSIAAAQESQAGLYSIRVTNLFGSAESSNALLTVLPPPPVPVIYSFAPGKAKVGEAVQLVGTNFSDVAVSNIVYFGAVRALVVAASPTSLTVVVTSGATFAPPSVTVAGLSGQASQSFLPTYAGGHGLDSSSFAPKVDFAASSPQATVVIGDLDGDGKPDLLVGNYNASSVSVYRNISSNGVINATSFAPRVTFATGSAPLASLADVDGDGKLDILVANNGNGGGNTISILRNTSTPGAITNTSFAPRVNFTTATGPLKVAAADLDGDGRLDLAVCAANARVVSVLRNTGTPGVVNPSSFAPRVDLGPNLTDRDLTLADLDGDGKLDIVATHFSGGFVSLLRNTATRGSLTTNSFERATLETGSAYNAAVGDLDEDGKLDLIVDNRPSSIGVFRNVSTPGSLSSNSFAPKISFPVSGEPYLVAIGDVDGDGRPDLAASVMNLYSVAVLRNTAAPGIINSNSFAARVLFATGSSPRNVVLGDLDADGRPDLAVANLLSSFVSVLKNLTLPPAPPSFVTQPVSQSVVLGDQVVFSASATGALAYQWQFNGDNLPGQTDSSLLLPDAQLDQAGSYTVVATNLYGPAMSTGAVLAITIPNCVTPPAGLVAWWSGNGDALDSVNTNHGVTQSGVGFAAGKAGQAFQLGVTNNGVRIPASSALDVGTGNGMTIECWINLATVTGNCPLVEWNDGVPGGAFFGTHLYVGPYGAGSLYANLVGAGDVYHQIHSTAGVVKSNVFQHIALTYDRASGVTRLFCNGAIVAEQNLGAFTHLTGNDLYLGKRPTGDVVVNSTGLMDEVNLYNRALTTNEIAAIYAARGTGKCPLPPIVLNVTPPSWFVNEGQTVSFTALAVGSSPLSFQWQLGGTDVAGATSPLLVLSNVVYAQAGNYSVIVSNAGGTTTSSNVVLRINRAPLADASATDLLVIAPPQCDTLTNTAVVVLDGSRASDLDGDALSYAWFSAGDINAFATGVVAVTTLPIGTNQLTLTVSDGLAANSQSFAIEVISTSQAVDRLAALVQADMPKANAILASLRAALASIDRCQPATAINQLEAFKNKVVAQIAPSDPALADQLLADAQAIIDALNGGTSPVLATLEITSINRGDNGKSLLRIKGAAGRVHIVETSTDMVNWVKVGVAGCCGGADYQFDDAQTASTGMRFYRVVSPK